jgi:hypothetical protein
MAQLKPRPCYKAREIEFFRNLLKPMLVMNYGWRS